MRDPQLIGPAPFYTAGPCGLGQQFTCGPFGPSTGTSPREAGFFRFDWDTEPFFILAVRYEVPPFQQTQTVCNTIELYGATPVNGLSGDFGPLQFLATDTKCHELVPPQPDFNAQKIIFTEVEHTDSAYIGENVIQESALSNNGNVVLTGACVTEILPAELDVIRIQAKGSYQGTFTVTIYYTDGSNEVVTNFPQAGILFRDQGDFTVPMGEFVDSVLFCSDGILPPRAIHPTLGQRTGFAQPLAG